MDLLKVFLILAFMCCSVRGWKIFYRGRPKHGLLGGPVVRNPFQKLPPSEWFEQKLDHFKPTETTWKQRYYTNETFYKDGGPVFLLISGEGTANATWMVEGSVIEYAAKFKALCFQLEHRFYGESHPTEDMSVKNLVYLSSEQALADLANFIEGMTSKYSLPPGTKWIAFGGSYSGSLAAWLRLKYPHLVHAAVSTSGPLLAIADFQDYYGVVEASLSTAGGEDCVKAIRNATQQIDILLRHVLGLNTLKTLFRLCDDIDPDNDNDVANLYESLATNFADVVQYNKDNREFEGAKATNITIDVVCGVMSNSTIGPALHRYAAVSNMLLDAHGEKCLDFSYKKMVESMHNATWGSGGARQWTYQTCVEFGFFQTSTQKSHSFGDKFPVEFYIQQCSDIFGRRFTESLLDIGIKQTNQIYGALSIEVSNVVFVHGSIDPWHALGITKNMSAAPAIFIEGTAHCANMYPSLSSDPPQLIAARTEISQLIKLWLQD